MKVDLLFEPLGAGHDRAAFSCGVESLDRYLKQQASQDLRRRVAAVFVAREPTSSVITGYYTLAAFGIAPASLPPEIAKRLPRYDQLPSTRIGRLAVDQRHQGQGIGRRLLMDALDRSYQMAPSIASMAVVVDAIDDTARHFYARFGFQRFLDDEYRLYLPMATIAPLVTGT